MMCVVPNRTLFLTKAKACEKTRMEENIVWSIQVEPSICVSGRQPWRNEKSTHSLSMLSLSALASSCSAEVATWPGLHVHRAGPVNGLYGGHPAIYVADCTGILHNANGPWPAMRVISLGIRTVPVLSVAKKLAATRPSSDSTCRQHVPADEEHEADWLSIGCWKTLAWMFFFLFSK